MVGLASKTGGTAPGGKDMRAKFPETLDRPIQIIWWEVDELVPLISGLILYLITDDWLFLIAGYFGTRFYSKYKSKLPDGFLIHLGYFLGLVDITGYPSYLIGEFWE